MLQGQKTYLSPLTRADSETLFGWINDRESLLNSAPYKPTHLPQHLEWFDSITNRSDTVIFGINQKSDHKLIGTCQLHSISPIHRSAELQIRIGMAEARGQGLGKDACGLLLRHAFDDLNLHRVHLHVLAPNAAARRLYQSLGFNLEGQLRDAVFIDGRWSDVVMMGLLEREFEPI